MPLSRLTTNSFTPNGITLKDISTAPSQLNGMKNLLINGDFRVWQKGTDLNPLTTGNAITGVDRWTNQYCDFTARLRKVEDTINGETVDTVEITKNSGTYSSCEFTQKVETNVAKYLRGQTVTFSFWVKKVGSTFGTHSCQFWLGDSETVDDTGWTNQRTYDRGRSSGVTGTNSNIAFSNNNWTKYSVTRTLSADTNTIYCTIYTASTPTGEGIRIAKCQLEVGSTSTDFERRPIALENAMCQRYFYNTSQPLYGAGGEFNIGFFTAQGSNYGYMLPQHPAIMRAAPTLSFGGSFNTTITGGQSGTTLTQALSTPVNALIQVTGSGWSSGQMGRVISNNNQAGYVTFNSEF